MRESRHILAWVIVLAIAARVGIFLFAMIVPIPDSLGNGVSPLNFYSQIDLNTYAGMRDVLFHGAPWWSGLELEGSPIEVVLAMMRYAYFDHVGPFGSVFVPGPIQPIVYHIFDYREGNTLPLATVNLAMSCAAVSGWLWWVWRQGLGRWWMAVIALLPGPIWLALHCSTDTLFALLTIAFFLTYFHKGWGDNRIIVAALIAFVAVWLRPNALALGLFLFVDQAILFRQTSVRLRWMLTGIAVLFIPAGLYYLPYFFNFTDLEYVGRMPVYGIPRAEWEAGLFPSLPRPLDLALSWAGLWSGKVLYLVGLRPSFADANPMLMALRAAPGVLLLPGLVWAFVSAPRSQLLFVVIFVLPIVAGLSQDRYLVPIEFLLIYYTAQGWQRLCAVGRSGVPLFGSTPPTTRKQTPPTA